jgi:hypothetical protein
MRVNLNQVHPKVICNMIASDSLNRVRTVLETDKGSVISDSIQEKDPDTLFPLQASLGYDIAQPIKTFTSIFQWQ